MRISDIIERDKILSGGEHAEIEFESICTSDKEIGERTVFIYIKSIKGDNLKTIRGACDKGAMAIICNEDTDTDGIGIPVLRLLDTRRELSEIYFKFYKIDTGRCRFIGITGTNGKSTTAELLKRILAYGGASVGLIGTGKIESDGRVISDPMYSMTTPDPDLLAKSIRRMQDDGCKYIIMEVSSHALALGRVSAIPFDIAVFTNISAEHLDFHGSMEEYVKTKLLLTRSAKLCIFNMDDKRVRDMYRECTAQKLGYGIVSVHDIYAHDIDMRGIDGSEYIYRDKRRIFKVKLPLIGAHNIYNSVAAISAATELGMPACIIKRAIAETRSIDGRLELIRGGGINIIIDYAHTEEAFKTVLKAIKPTVNFGQKLITVFGCGGERYKEKRAAMARCAEEHSSLVIVTEDNSRSEPAALIIEDILSGFSSPARRTVIPSRAAAIEHAVMIAEDGDTVALLGKGHERYTVDAEGYHPFDEREAVRAALLKRSEKKNENKA